MPEDASATAPPTPFGPVPTAPQLRWHALETTAFVHFTTNTFTGCEWGYGDEEPEIFEPTEFDADETVRELAAADMKGIILTAKHHDGFCLWPTATTEHSVKNSPWRAGGGDVVAEFAAACKRHDVQFGIYLSPWDRNNPDYGRPEYLEIYRTQLRELLTGYGPLFEVWCDGANGGDGHYGGANEQRHVDVTTYYGWPTNWELVRSLQPEAVIFSDVGPDVRWVGNEDGIAGETCWATYCPVGLEGREPAPGAIDIAVAPVGQRGADRWMPAECDVSIRPGWFWHEHESPMGPEKLMDVYFSSVGRGAVLLLGLPPGPDGRLDPRDVDVLRTFTAQRRALFETDLAADAMISASDCRGPGFAPGHLVDGDPKTYWATADDVHEPHLAIEFGRPTVVSVVRLREAVHLGQRVDRVALDAWADGAWTETAAATSIGMSRLIRLTTPIETTALRLRITAAAGPALSELAVY
ncbi:alpha-L-fucosidase [Pseudonocardia sp. TRM90224]|uniref:alpha-L-fucosidase n=1 Tax=Pseudonocardia sp. TRM90224 TaxID=2812678 RepID=UPI001E646882|nr:alpha-L-fucosidase [Pseudonocardia sp. TRM90224]